MHYFLTAFFPLLSMEKVPEISTREVKSYFSLNLSKGEMEKVEKIFRFIDIQNIRSLLFEGEIDYRGNLSEKEIEELLLSFEGVPEYIIDFLRRYESKEERRNYFASLLSTLFREEIRGEKGFLCDYFSFERELRLVILGHRVKEEGRDLVKELQFEDLHDPFVIDMLMQKDSVEYTPPFNYKEVGEIFNSTKEHPWERHRLFTAYRFKKIREMVEGKNAFSFDTILAYTAQLLLIEDWHQLNREKGEEILEELKTEVI